eukprot:366293-Chlamydomonas_euryale.AAC.5
MKGGLRLWLNPKPMPCGVGMSHEELLEWGRLSGRAVTTWTAAGPHPQDRRPATGWPALHATHRRRRHARGTSKWAGTRRSAPPTPTMCLQRQSPWT